MALTLSDEEVELILQHRARATAPTMVTPTVVTLPPEPKGRKARAKYHKDAKAAKKMFKEEGYKFLKKHYRPLSNFFEGKEDAHNAVEILFFLHPSKFLHKLLITLPAGAAAVLPFTSGKDQKKILLDSRMGTFIADAVIKVDPSLSYQFYDQYPADFFLVFHKGEVPKATLTHLSDEPVADGERPIFQHPNINAKNLTLTTDRNCLPYYLLNYTPERSSQSFKDKWDNLPIAKRVGLYKDPVTIDSILRTVRTTDPVMPVKDLAPFFKLHRLHVRVYSLRNDLLWEYNPESEGKSRNKDIHSTLSFVQHDAHIMPINHNAASFCHKDHAAKKWVKAVAMAETEIQSLDALRDFLRTCAEPTTVYFSAQQDPESVLLFLMKNMNLKPQVSKAHHNCPQDFVLYVPHKVVIKTLDVRLATMKTVQSAVLTPLFRSVYHETTRRVYNDLKRGHLRFSFLAVDVPCERIDVVRAYTAMSRKLSGSASTTAPMMCNPSTSPSKRSHATLWSTAVCPATLITAAIFATTT